MVRDTGIPMSTYQRIESGEYDRLPYQQLNNCARVLEVDVDQLIDERFKEWTTYHQSATRPPKVPSWRKSGATTRRSRPA